MHRVFLSVLGVLCLPCLGWGSVFGADWTCINSNTPWAARHSFTSVVFKNKAWIIGGDRIPVNTFLNDVWSSNDGVSWTQATDHALWSVRGGHSSVAFDGKLWVFGGCTPATPPANIINDVWSSSNGIDWTQVTSHAQWSDRYLHQSVVFQNKMWVIGGVTPVAPCNDVWSSSDGITWTQVTPHAPWSPRSSHSCVVHNGEMWIIGGSDGLSFLEPGSFFSDVWHSPDGFSWTQATSLPLASAGHVSIDYGGRIWVIAGGHLEGTTPVTNTEILSSTDGVTWSANIMNPPSWEGRGGTCSVLMNDKIVLLSGTRGSNGIDAPDVWSTQPHLQFVQVPFGGNKEVGDSLNLSVAVTGTIGTVSYQWFKDEISIPDMTTATYHVAGMNLIDSGAYSCRVSDESLITRDTPPAIIKVYPAGSLPALGIVGVSILSALCAATGMFRMCRRSKQGSFKG